MVTVVTGRVLSDVRPEKEADEHRACIEQCVHLNIGYATQAV